MFAVKGSGTSASLRSQTPLLTPLLADLDAGEGRELVLLACGLGGVGHVLLDRDAGNKGVRLLLYAYF